MCGGEVGEILGSQLGDDLRKWISFVWILVPVLAVHSDSCHHTVCSCSPVQVHKFSAHTLYNVSKVLAMNKDQPVTTFKEFKELLPMLGAPEPPINSPELAITKLLTCEDDVQGNDYR